MFTLIKETDALNNVDATGSECDKLKHSMNLRLNLSEDFARNKCHVLECIISWSPCTCDTWVKI